MLGFLRRPWDCSSGRNVLPQGRMATVALYTCASSFWDFWRGDLYTFVNPGTRAKNKKIMHNSMNHPIAYVCTQETNTLLQTRT